MDAPLLSYNFVVPASTPGALAEALRRRDFEIVTAIKAIVDAINALDARVTALEP